VLDSIMQLLALIPTRLYDNNKISMPQVRRTFMVSKRRHGFDTKVSLWIESLSLQGAGRRNYYRVLGGAGSRHNLTVKRDKDLQVSSCSEKRISKNYQDWGHSRSSWIKRQGNGIISRNFDGPRASGESECPERASRRLDLATNNNSKKTFRN